MNDADKSKGLPVVDVSSNHKEIIVTEKTVLADRSDLRNILAHVP